MLATVLGAVDRGYRVIVVQDGICSSSDAGHDALITLYRQRLSEPIETATAEEALSRWYFAPIRCIRTMTDTDSAGEEGLQAVSPTSHRAAPAKPRTI